MSILNKLKRKKNTQSNGRIYNTNFCQHAPIIRPSEVTEDYWIPVGQGLIEEQKSDAYTWWTRPNPEGVSNKDVLQMFVFGGILVSILGFLFYMVLKK